MTTSIRALTGAALLALSSSAASDACDDFRAAIDSYDDVRRAAIEAGLTPLEESSFLKRRSEAGTVSREEATFEIAFEAAFEAIDAAESEVAFRAAKVAYELSSEPMNLFNEASKAAGLRMIYAITCQ